MDTTLTPQQVSLLFDYCSSEQLPYYDVQLEVVDHLAAWIEAEREKTGAGFRETFLEMTRQFSGADFKTIARQKRWSLYRRFWKLAFGEFSSYAGFPKILGVIALVLVLYVLVPAHYAATSLAFGGMLLLDIYIAIFNRVKTGAMAGRPKAKPFRALISFKTIWSLQLLINLFWLVPTLLISLPGFHSHYHSDQYLFLFKSFYAIYIVLLLSLVHIRVRMLKDIRSQYPQAFAHE